MMRLTASRLNIGKCESLAKPDFRDGGLGVQHKVSRSIALAAARMRK